MPNVPISKKPPSRILTGSELLKDMKKYHREVAQSSDSARNFLVRLGVMTTDGKTKKLIRG